MKKLTVALNALTAALFIAFFAYTFFAHSHLSSLARDFVTEKTLHYSGPVIDTVEKTLDVPVVAKLVSRDDIEVVRAEIDTYRDDPAAYVSDLTGQKLAIPARRKIGAIAKKVTEAKEQIRKFYNDTLTALIADLRIFSGTNTVAAILAIVLTLKSRPPVTKPLVAFSFLLFVALVFCSYLYIDHLSFFRILTSTHMGWWYPVIVVIVAAWLYKDIGELVETAT